MDLRGGTSLWQYIDPAPPASRPLLRNESCEVAIIGGGVTGALAAFELTQAGRDVLLLDRRPLAMGSTLASTGLLQYEIDVPLVKLAKMIGGEDAVRAYRLCARALPAFEEITGELGHSCGLKRRRSLFLARGARDVKDLREECAARQEAGIQVDFLDREELRHRFGIRRAAALLSRHAAEIDPYRFTQRLLAHARRAGLRAYSPTEVARYEHRPRYVVLHTPEGHRVPARHVIFATGYETPDFLDAATTSLKSTYAIVTEPVAEKLWPGKALIWESGSPYFYARGAAGNRIIAGGEDDDFKDPARRDAAIPRKKALLEAKLRRLFPRIPFKTESAWAGTFATTADGLPYIGPHPKFPRGLFALGYGGNGITYALIAARLMHDMIAGKKSPEWQLFGFGRAKH